VEEMEEMSRNRIEPFRPEDGPTLDDVHALYGRDMYHLTASEREHILQDIHGVLAASASASAWAGPASTSAVTPSSRPDPPRQQQQSMSMSMSQRPSHDDPEWVKARRHELKRALMESDTTCGTAPYSMALRSNARYVQSARHVEVPFLRSTGWDAQAAAQKILDFFRVKLKLFGPQRLGQPCIGLQDLSKEDRKCLESGMFQLLPVRDVAGRAIFVIMPGSRGPNTSIDTVVRIT
jgi:hypothetical protein